MSFLIYLHYLVDFSFIDCQRSKKTIFIVYINNTQVDITTMR